MHKARIGILGVILTQIRVYFVKSNTQGAKMFLKCEVLIKFDEITANSWYCRPVKWADTPCIIL